MSLLIRLNSKHCLWHTLTYNFANVGQVLNRYVPIRRELWIRFLSFLLILEQALDLVNLGLHRLQLHVELLLPHDLPLQRPILILEVLNHRLTFLSETMVRIKPNFVFSALHDQADALQNVRNIVNAALLHSEDNLRDVQVKCLPRTALDQGQKPMRQCYKAVFLSDTLTEHFSLSKVAFHGVFEAFRVLRKLGRIR